MPTTRRPTDAELAILRVLWAHGPRTVREVATVMGREDSYTTVLKLLQIMTDKGLVARDERARTHVYSAAVSEADTERLLVGDLVHRVFDGAAGKLVLRALEDGDITPGDLAEIRRLLNRKGGERS